LTIPFPLHDTASAVYALVECPFVRSSHASNVPKQPSTGSHKQHYMIAQGLVFYSKHLGEIPTRSAWIISNGGAKWRWGRFKSVIFNKYLVVSQKWCKTGTWLLWNANKNSYVLYQMALFPANLRDP